MLYLRPGDAFYDIGANAGVFSMDLAKAVPDLTALIFEPQPSLAGHIRQSIAANGFDRMTLFEVMLGAEDREASLFLTSHSVHASAVPREQRYRELRVPMRKLDGLVRDERIAPPDLIKIDVEGSELSVFRGAIEVLHRHQPTVVFEADDNMQRAGHKASDLHAILSAAAPYTYHYIDPKGAVEPAPPSYPNGNYLALSPRHADRLPRRS